MGQGHVAGAEFGEHPEHRQIFLDGHAPLDPDQRGDLARLDDPLDVVGRVGDGQLVGIAARPGDRRGRSARGPSVPGSRARWGCRPTRTAAFRPPVAEPGEVGVASRTASASRSSRAPCRRPPGAAGEVVVAVEEDRRGVDLPCPVRDQRRGARRRRPGGRGRGPSAPGRGRRSGGAAWGRASGCGVGLPARPVGASILLRTSPPRQPPSDAEGRRDKAALAIGRHGISRLIPPRCREPRVGDP